MNRSRLTVERLEDRCVPTVDPLLQTVSILPTTAPIEVTTTDTTAPIVNPASDGTSYVIDPYLIDPNAPLPPPPPPSDTPTLPSGLILPIGLPFVY